MEVYVSGSTLQEYRDKLLRYRAQVIEQAESVRRLCLSVSWKDEVYEAMRKCANSHFLIMDKLLSGIDDVVASLNKMINALDRYFSISV